MYEIWKHSEPYTISFAGLNFCREIWYQSVQRSEPSWPWMCTKESEVKTTDLICCCDRTSKTQDLWSIGAAEISQKHPFTRRWKHKSLLTTTVKVLLKTMSSWWSTARLYKEACQANLCSGFSPFIVIWLPLCNSGLRWRDTEGGEQKKETKGSWMANHKPL